MKPPTSPPAAKAVRGDELSPVLAWLKNHNVRTHEFTSDLADMRTFRWIAYVGKSVPPHEDSNRTWATGETEDDTLIRLAQGMKWLLWNEELAEPRPLNAKPLNDPSSATASTARPERKGNDE